MLLHRKPADQLKRGSYTAHDLSHIRESCVATNLGRANRIVGRIFEEAFRDMSISSPQFELMVSLKIKPDSTAGDIAEATRADPSTVSRNTDVLIRRGLVSVTQCTKDRRVRIYCLTEDGEEMIQSCIPQWRKAQRTSLRRIGRGEWIGVRRALRRLVR